MKRIFAATLVIIALTTFGCNKHPEEENKIPDGSAQYVPDNGGAIDSKAPDFTVTTVNDKQIHLSDYKGKVVIVDFWATWCPPCRKGIPDLIDIQKNYGSDVVVIGISVDTDSKNDVIPFVKSNGINYQVAYANPEVVQAYGGIESIPTSFVIDKNGKIVDKHIGLVPKSDFTSVIDKLLKK